MVEYEDTVPGPAARSAAAFAGGTRIGRRWRLRLRDRYVLAPARGFALLGAGVWNAAAVCLVAGAAATVAIGAGLFLLPPSLTMMRATADAARRRARAWGGVEIPDPYRPSTAAREPAPGFSSRMARLGARLGDPQTWRDLAWPLLDGTVGAALAALAAGLLLYGVYGFVIGILWTTLTRDGMDDWYTFIHVHGGAANQRWEVFPIGAVFIVGSGWAAPALIRAHALCTGWVLGPTASARQAALARRVARLTESRADAVDTQAAELRRIERDLHDGAQARLVAMGMNLGAAEALLDEHPEAAKAMLAQARESSSKALTELRELIRGIHPPVLADRGLGDAVRALALDSALHVEVAVDLPGRLEPAAESAAYFAVAELLTNVAKHAKAAQVRVELRYRAGRLRVACTDDGQGGALLSPDAASRAGGSGLAGIERRIAAFDGAVSVHSPAGGPTVVVLEIPCSEIPRAA